MFRRRWISVVSILGLLLHAGLFARHNAMALNLASTNANLAESYGVICSANRGLPAVGDWPGSRSTGKKIASCPFCSGILSGAVVLPTPIAFQAPPISKVVGKPVAFVTTTLTSRFQRPQGRAPPDSKTV